MLALEEEKVWRLRKLAELTLLAAELENYPTLNWEGLASLQRLKRDIGAECLAKSVRATSQRETAFGPHAGPFDWRYQRFDLRASAGFDAVQFFAGWRPSVAHDGVAIPMASGMSAIAVALMALDLLCRPGTSLLHPDGLYFETAAFARRYLHRLALDREGKRPSSNPWVALVDVGAMAALERQIPIGPRDGFALVIDTTATHRCDEMVQSLTNSWLTGGIPVLLCRSHLKLDFLGTEYHRLGSLTVLLPEHSTKMPFLVRAALVRAVDDITARLGVRALAWAVPRWWMIEGFDDLARERTLRLRAANQALANELRTLLKGCRVSVECPHSAPFFVLTGLANTADDARRHAEDLVGSLREMGIDAFHASSFGHDVLTADAVQVGSGGKWGLRIAAPDWSKTHHCIAMEGMQQWLADGKFLDYTFDVSISDES